MSVSSPATESTKARATDDSSEPTADASASKVGDESSAGRPPPIPAEGDAPAIDALSELKDDAEDEVVLWPLAGDLPVLAFFGVRGPGELTPRGELREGEVVR